MVVRRIAATVLTLNSAWAVFVSTATTDYWNDRKEEATKGKRTQQNEKMLDVQQSAIATVIRSISLNVYTSIYIYIYIKPIGQLCKESCVKQFACDSNWIMRGSVRAMTQKSMAKRSAERCYS